MRVLTDLDVLKVHVNSEGIWYLDGAGLPTRLATSVAEFARGDLVERANRIRLVGSAQNAELIVALYGQKCCGRLASLEVVTPLVCATRRERASPTTVLYSMRRFRRAPSQGGFHEVVDADLHSYALVYALQQDGSVTERVLQLLSTHPAWKPLQFIPTLNPVLCARLLAHIIDPRWFVDPCRPDRGAKLHRYLGLMPAAQARVNRGGASRRDMEWCRLVLECWKNVEREDEVVKLFELTGPFAMATAKSIGIRPGDFLWRVWGYLAGVGAGSRNPPRSGTIADLRASMRFIDFLRSTWIQELYRGAQLPDDGLLFDADYFFRQDIVAADAYRHHMQIS